MVKRDMFLYFFIFFGGGIAGGGWGAGEVKENIKDYECLQTMKNNVLVNVTILFVVYMI